MIAAKAVMPAVTIPPIIYFHLLFFLGIEEDIDPFEMFNKRREVETKIEEKKNIID